MLENEFSIKNDNEIKNEILKGKFTKDSMILFKEHQYEFSIPCHHSNKPEMELSLNQEMKENIQKPNVLNNIKTIRQKISHNQSNVIFKIN